MKSFLDHHDLPSKEKNKYPSQMWRACGFPVITGCSLLEYDHYILKRNRCFDHLWYNPPLVAGKYGTPPKSIDSSVSFLKRAISWGVILSNTTFTESHRKPILLSDWPRCLLFISPKSQAMLSTWVRWPPSGLETDSESYLASSAL